MTALMMFDVLVVLQVEVVVDGVTNGEDTKDEVKQGSNGSIVTINVLGLVTTEETRGLRSFDGTLGQLLIILNAFYI